MTHDQLVLLIICAIITLIVSIVGNVVFTKEVSKTKPILAFLLFITNSALTILFIELVINLIKLL